MRISFRAAERSSRRDKAGNGGYDDDGASSVSTSTHASINGNPEDDFEEADPWDEAIDSLREKRYMYCQQLLAVGQSVQCAAVACIQLQCSNRCRSLLLCRATTRERALLAVVGLLSSMHDTEGLNAR